MKLAPRVRLRRVEPMLRRALRDPGVLERGDTLLVAVSGGADSTALLVALASLAHEHGLTLHAAHLHHGLRGHEADADRAHTVALCASLGVPCTTARIAAGTRMRERGLSGEAGLRTLRREWLTRVAARAGARAIATAHTADDQLETLFLRLARGTGLSGAAGMRAWRGRWWKPLLECTRAELEADLVKAGIAWRDDASNATRDYTRNRIRHEVVPALLDAIGAPAGRATERRAGLARRAQALARELQGAARLAERRAARAFRRLAGPEGRTIDRPGLDRLDPLVARLVLRRWWAASGPRSARAPGLTARHLDPLLAALGRGPGGPGKSFSIALPLGWRAVATRGTLTLERPGGRAGRGRTAARQASAPDARLRHRRSEAPTGTPARSSQAPGQNGRHPTTARR